MVSAAMPRHSISCEKGQTISQRVDGREISGQRFWLESPAACLPRWRRKEAKESAIVLSEDEVAYRWSPLESFSRAPLARTRLPAPLISPNHRTAFTALSSFCKSLLLLFPPLPPPPPPPRPRLYIAGYALIRQEPPCLAVSLLFALSHLCQPFFFTLVRLPPSFPLRESYSPRPLPLSLPPRQRMVSVGPDCPLSSRNLVSRPSGLALPCHSSPIALCPCHPFS